MGEYVISLNKKALHDYEFDKHYQAGLVLHGGEIKAIRAGKVNLRGSFARIQYPKGSGDAELVVTNFHIGAGEDPTRTRKLLLHRKEINQLMGKLQEKRFTLIPIKLYLARGYAKLELGLGRGRKQYEKRDRLKRKHKKRALDRDMRGE
ncbi:MAG: SsrA-binding protein SmpB [Patescibacteria group bacterium]